MLIKSTVSSVVLFAVIELSLGGECGQPVIASDVSLNLTGKQDAVPHSWPWHVGFYKNPYVKEGVYFCSGALIDARTVVTAAHCMIFALDEVVVHLGDHLRLSRDSGEELANISSVCSHPSFVKDVQDDIAVVRLNESVQFSPTISPICLPEKGDQVREDDALFVTGWGLVAGGDMPRLSNGLKQTRQNPISRERCLAMDPTQLLDKVICTNHDLGSACHGDSGGPLVLARRNIWQLQGILSGGPSICGDLSRPAYYTEISEYLNWIKDVQESSDTVGLCETESPATRTCPRQN